MKKALKLVALAALLAAMAAFVCGCFGAAPKPTVKEGEFAFSVTYEVKGEIKTVSGVYVCKFKHARMHWDGVERKWDGYVKDSDLTNEIKILSNEDGVIYLDLDLDAAYFMSDPFSQGYQAKPSFVIQYHEDKREQLGLWSYEPEVLAAYGVRVLDYDYAPPIENTYQ